LTIKADVGPLFFFSVVSLSFFFILSNGEHVCFSTLSLKKSNVFLNENKLMSDQEGAVSRTAVSSFKRSFSSALSAAGNSGTMYGPARPMTTPTSPKTILAFRDKRL